MSPTFLKPTLSLITLLLTIYPFIQCSSTSPLLSHFPDLSLYIQTPESTTSPHQIKTSSLLISKYSKQHLSQTSNSLNIFISPLYNKNVLCLDINQSNFYTLKNNLLNYLLKPTNPTIKNYYTEIFDENTFCMERLEYYDNETNLHEKDHQIHLNYFYNLFYSPNAINPSSIPLIQHITDININEMHSLMLNELNTFKLMNNNNVNKHWGYQLSFGFENDKFILNTLYLILPTQLNIETYLSNVLSKTKDVLINSKGIQTFDPNSFLCNHSIKIKTNKDTSVYHNMMEVHFNKDIIKSYNSNDNKCFVFHYILTEDVYIEKNEFRNLVNEYIGDLTSVNYTLYASNFIEQELSSDLSGQAFFSFHICINENELNKLHNIIKFPVHFRYQPSVDENSTLTHQTVIMPQPLVLLVDSTFNYKKDFIQRYVKTSQYANFTDEIKHLLETHINEFTLFTNNYQQLQHLIPIVQGKNFLIVAIITSITAILGFIIILRSLLVYVVDKNENKVKID